jgi:hypothetical protein
MKTVNLARVFNWLGAWLHILHEIIYICTFTLIYTKFQYTYMFWSSRVLVKYNKNKKLKRRHNVNGNVQRQ